MLTMLNKIDLPNTQTRFPDLTMLIDLFRNTSGHTMYM